MKNRFFENNLNVIIFKLVKLPVKSVTFFIHADVLHVVVNIESYPHFHPSKLE